MEKYIEQLNDLHFLMLDENRYKQLKFAHDSLVHMADTAVPRTYSTIMLNLGSPLDNRNEILATVDAPYLYLQTIYQFVGAPNALKEKLITIDEAQGVANQEISLIRNVNGGNVILNLFGDEKQHFEDTKGIDSWNEIMQGSSYKRYDMNENYRNARQITEYCNKCFDLQMQSINVDGRGVHEIWGYETFISECIRIFQSAQNNGLRAIITRTQEEKRYLLEVFSDYRDSLHPLGESDVEIHRNRWNVLTVMEARGLEFGSVIAVAGRMTPNERYVVYTRALDELFVYDEVIYIPDKPVIDDIGGDKWEKPSDYEKKKNKKNNPKKEQVNERGRSKGDYDHSELRDYFTNAGFEVIDQRADGKLLWVVGDRTKLQPIVDEAVNKFGISGRYYNNSPVTRHRSAWCTKAKS